MKMALALTAALALSACNTTWNKPGLTQEQFNLDEYNCDKDAHQSFFGGGLIGAVSQQKFYERCMVAHGYAKVE
jgi:hypothetical protein